MFKEATMKVFDEFGNAVGTIATPSDDLAGLVVNIGLILIGFVIWAIYRILKWVVTMIIKGIKSIGTETNN